MRNSLLLLASASLLGTGCTSYERVAEAQQRSLNHLWALEAALSFDDADGRAAFLRSHPTAPRTSSDRQAVGLALGPARQRTLANVERKFVELATSAAWKNAQNRSDLAWRVIWAECVPLCRNSTVRWPGELPGEIESTNTAVKAIEERLEQASPDDPNAERDKAELSSERERLARLRALHQRWLDSQSAIQADLYAELDKRLEVTYRFRALHDGIFSAIRALRESGERNLEYLKLGFFSRLFTDLEGLDRDKLKQIGDDLKAAGENLKPYFEERFDRIARGGAP